MQGVTSLQEDSGRSSVAIEDGVFEVPRAYDVLGGSSENTMRMYNQSNDEEEIMLQYAIRQSLAQPGDQVSCFLRAMNSKTGSGGHLRSLGRSSTYCQQTHEWT